ncbi:MAG TPA: hypothetical protein VFI39_12570 [Gemmatimonadales bacterium]|nr:hypothetical protein [Gemmatimonadales bacterium]
MIHQRYCVVALGSLLLAAGCRFEQRPPAGPAREQASAQVAVASYYDALARGTPGVVRDTALAADSLVLVRSDVQVQRDLGTAWVTVRVIPGGGTRLQLLSLRRTGTDWIVDRVATASP